MNETSGPRIQILRQSHFEPPRIQVLNRREREPGIPPHENVRLQLLQRHSTFEIEMSVEDASRYGESSNAVAMAIIEKACSYREPFRHDDFDYLRRSIRRISATTRRSSSRVSVQYSIGYLTSRAQEEQLDHHLRKLLFEKNAYAISGECNKVRFAYGFIARYVNYDKTLRNISAYDALFHGSAVCEGCATLLYRMLSMLGVRSRIITGTSQNENHAWNIVWLNGSWYNVDVTWDLGVVGNRLFPPRYRYFLIGDDHFADHVRDPEFLTNEFLAEHPVARSDYR